MGITQNNLTHVHEHKHKALTTSANDIINRIRSTSSEFRLSIVHHCIETRQSYFVR